MTFTALRYKKEYCQKLVDHMKTGMSFESFGPTIGTHRTTLYDWVKKYPDFAQAQQAGQDAAFNFWEKLLIAKAYGQKQDINIIAVIFCLKTRFHKHYGENKRLELSGEIGSAPTTDLSPVSDEDLITMKSILNKNAPTTKDDE